jgi:hypothetical protein
MQTVCGLGGSLGIGLQCCNFSNRWANYQQSIGIDSNGAWVQTPVGLAPFVHLCNGRRDVKRDPEATFWTQSISQRK